MPDLYHSAHLAPVTTSPRFAHVSTHGVALVHDVTTGPLPKAYSECDLLYADLPWRAGFHEFNLRAGVADDRRYGEFMDAVSDLIRGDSRPVVLVTGRHAAKLLPPPDYYRPGLDAHGE